MNVRPMQDRVLIKPLEDEQKTAGGIIVPDTAKEKPMKGKVVAAGPGKFSDDGKRQPMDVKVGDTVMFGKYSGTEFKMDNQEYLVIGQSDILVIFEN
jgi:chaperonin GroES